MLPINAIVMKLLKDLLNLRGTLHSRDAYHNNPRSLQLLRFLFYGNYASNKREPRHFESTIRNWGWKYTLWTVFLFSPDKLRRAALCTKAERPL